MDKNIWLVLGILVIIGVLLFGGKFSSGGNGSNPSGAGNYKVASIDAYFADKEYNEVVPKTVSAFSTVTLPGLGGVPLQGQNIYFMRVDINAKNEGTLSKSVKITDIVVRDANSNIVESSIIGPAFRCIINKPINLNPFQSYTWGTNPKDATTGCSSLVWVPTFLFEKYNQPLSIEATVIANFTLMGISKSSSSIIKGIIAITNDTTGWGSISGGIIGGGLSSFLTECNAGETQACPFSDVVGSVCYGITQSCKTFLEEGSNETKGLWTGCSLDSYGPYFTPNTESSGNALQGGFEATCNDGRDNDCDGVKDKPPTDGSACSTCDWDCPPCVVTFRTNADIDSFPTCSIGSICSNPYQPIAGQDFDWIAIRNTPTDEYLTSYGYDGSSSITSSNSLTISNILNGVSNPTTGYSFIGFTPRQNFAMWQKGGIIRMYYEDDSNNLNVRYMIFSSGSNMRCQVGYTYYPACTLRRQVPPFTLNNQEVCVDY